MRIGSAGGSFRRGAALSIRAGLRQADELAHASRRVSAIEINGTFYRTQNPASFAQMARRDAGGVCLFAERTAVLDAPGASWASGGAVHGAVSRHGFLELGDRLGPILWQFAPTTAFDPG